MNADRHDVAQNLRRDFDRSFAEPERMVRESRERLLGLSIDGCAYALHLASITVLSEIRKIVSVPGSQPELLGIVGHRGVLVPAFDLGRLLGHRRCLRARWIVLCRSDDPIALAFADLDGQLEVDSKDVRPLEGDARRQHVEAIAAGTPPRALVAVRSVLYTLTRQEP
jgi:chemotaxis signal transduction protein